MGKMISLVMSWVEGFAPSPSIPHSHSPIISDDRDHDCARDDDYVDVVRDLYIIGAVCLSQKSLFPAWAPKSVKKQKKRQ